MDDRIFVYGEGPTEKIVLVRLVDELEGNRAQVTGVGGKNKFVTRIIDDLESEFNPGVPDQYVRVLVFRDLDDGEKAENVRQSFSRIVRNLVHKERPWRPVEAIPNVSVCSIPPDNERSGLRLVLHLAEKPRTSPGNGTLNLPDFKDKTTDGYLLWMALTPNVLARFARDIRDIKVAPSTISRIVETEIPEMFRPSDADIRIPFDSDKDYLSAYLVSTRFWKVKRTEAKERLAGIILDRAIKYAKDDFKTIMGSWMAAFEEVQK